MHIERARETHGGRLSQCLLRLRQLRRCHENTRVAVITKIMDWVTSTIDADTHVLWLYGRMETGTVKLRKA